MSRWPPDAAGRLKAAALQLFAERGFAAVKGAEIAAAAGVSERTFFRHYRVKEDVLFEDYLGLKQAMASVIEGAPASASPREIMLSLADLLGERLGDMREPHRFLRDVVANEPRLRAREWRRDQEWAEAIAAGFLARGYSPGRARMLAQAMATTFRLAYDSWLADDEEIPLAPRFAQALHDLAADLAASAFPRG